MYALPQAFRKRTTTPGKSGSVSTGHLTARKTERHGPEGLWCSEGGSLYVCDSRALICISVHSAEFRGWIGKVAVRDIHRASGIWRGWQAFRDKQTGASMGWKPIRLVISGNRITKFFPTALSAEILVYGHLEYYYRVNLY